MDQTLVYVILVIFIATLIRSTLGFGEALVGVPLLALRIPMEVAAPLMVLISVLVAAIIIAQDWRHIEMRSATWLLGSSILGIPLGLVVLTQVHDQVIKLGLGVIILLFSIYSLTAKSRLHLQKDHRAWLLGAGFISGILGGAYGMNGPPLVVYGSLRRWSPQRFRATLQGYFLPAGVLGLVGYAYVGLWDQTVTWYFLDALPGVLIAILIGRALNHRLRGDGFFRAVYVGLIVTSVLLIAQAF